MNSSIMIPSHGHLLLRWGSFPWCRILQEQVAPALVPCRTQVFPAKLLQTGLLSPQDPDRTLFQHGFPTGPQPPSGVHLLQHRAELQGGSLLHCGSPQAAGEQLSCHSLHHRLQGNLCYSLSFFTDSSVWRVVSLTYSCSSFWLQLCTFGVFFQFLNMLSQSC